LIFQICVWDPKIGVWDPQGVPGPQVKNHWVIGLGFVLVRRIGLLTVHTKLRRLHCSSPLFIFVY